MTTTARDDVLGAIRRSLGRGDAASPAILAAVDARLAARRRQTIPARTELDPPALTALFAEKVEKAQGTVMMVDGMGAVPAAVSDFLRQQNLPSRIIMAPDATLDAAPWSKAQLLEIRRGKPTAADQVGVTSAFAGVAETGTLVALSGPDHPSTLNFLPETHIVVLPAARIGKCYEDVWDEIRRRYPDGPPRTVNMITGPSLSGDIEQTLTLGAHGPGRLHVIVVRDE